MLTTYLQNKYLVTLHYLKNSLVKLEINLQLPRLAKFISTVIQSYSKLFNVIQSYLKLFKVIQKLFPFISKCMLQINAKTLLKTNPTEYNKIQKKQQTQINKKYKKILTKYKQIQTIC